MGNGHWQLEGSSAELYQRHLMPAITTKRAEDLVDRARPRAGEAVLDVACSTGVVARLAAKTDRFGKVKWLSLFAVRDQIVLRAVAPGRCQLAVR